MNWNKQGVNSMDSKGHPKKDGISENYSVSALVGRLAIMFLIAIVVILIFFVSSGNLN